MSACMSAQNPKQAFANMIQQNPQVKQVIEFVQQCGGDPQTAFYKLAEMKHANPEEVLNSLK